MFELKTHVNHFLLQNVFYRINIVEKKHQ